MYVVPLPSSLSVYLRFSMYSIFFSLSCDHFLFENLIYKEDLLCLNFGGSLCITFVLAVEFLSHDAFRCVYIYFPFLCLSLSHPFCLPLSLSVSPCILSFSFFPFSFCIILYFSYLPHSQHHFTSHTHFSLFTNPSLKIRFRRKICYVQI